MQNAIAKEIVNRSSNFSDIKLEITTAIGCAMDCSYCPQSSLHREYKMVARDNYSGEKVMSRKRLQQILDNCPSDITLHWTGFVEPLMAPTINELLVEATLRGFKQRMNSTLYGATKKNIDLIFSGDMGRLNLHLPDEHGHMKMKIDSRYLEGIEYAMSLMRPGKDAIHFIGKPNEKIMDFIKYKSKICAAKLNDGIELTVQEFVNSRATNISHNPYTPILLEEQGIRRGQMHCGGKRFTQPNVLPNGMLVLCCMDYSLEEIHGDLTQNTLVDLLHKNLKDLAERISSGSESLCSKCEWLRPF